MPYRFAVIGCGRIAERHAAHIANHGILQAVCDTVEKRANAFGLQYNCRNYSSIEQLLHNEQVDVVSVCTPNGLHAEHSIMALNAGFHVLCEKPMAITTADGKKMTEAATAASRRLFVVKQNRFNPPVQAIKQLLQQNKIGRISSFQVNCFWNRPDAYYTDSWHGTKHLDGGILFTQFSHFIDLVVWFFGELETAYGHRSNFFHQQIEFEDAGIAVLKMKSGVIGTLHYTINTFKKNMEGSITIFGEKGTVKIGGQYLNEIDFFSVEGESNPELVKSQPANNYGFYEGSMSNHDKVYENLIKALDDATHDFVQADEAIKTVEMIEKIYAASPYLP